MRHLLMAGLGAALLNLGPACVDLPGIDPGTCGNRVVEDIRGEVCDGEANCGTPESDTPCEWLCGSTSDCLDGWMCGNDGACHQPSDAFQLGDTIGRPGIGYVVKDVDGDDADDVVARDANGLYLYVNPTDPELASAQRVFLPPGTVPGMFDANSDGRQDIVIGLYLGVALLMQDEEGSFVTEPQLTFDLAGNTPTCEEVQFESVHLPGEQKAVNAVIVGGQALYVGDCPPGEECLPCDLAPDVPSDTSTTVANGQLTRARLGPDGNGAMTYFVPVEGSSQLTYFRTQLAAAGGDCRHVNLESPLTLPEAFSANGFVRVGDFDDNGCPDILSVLSEDRAVVHLSGPEGACDAFAEWEEADIEGIPVVAAGKLFDDVGDSIVVASGDLVFSRVPGDEIRGIGVTNARVRTAIVFDYNADGMNDVVVASAAPVLDFFLNTGAGFNRFPVDLPSAASALTSTDVDGDLVVDLVAVLDGNDGVDGHDDLAVIFGGFEARPGDVHRFGTYATPMDVHISSDEVTLLVVNSNPAPLPGDVCRRPLTILIGDTSRQLIAPLVVSYPEDEGTLATQLIADIGSPEVATSTPPILVLGVRAIEDSIEDGFMTALLTAEADEADGGVDLVLDPAKTQSGTDLRPRLGRWATGTVVGAAVEFLDVVVLDHPCDVVGTCLGGAIHVIDGDTAQAKTGAIEWPADVVLPHEIALRDLDGDGLDDLLAVQWEAGAEGERGPAVLTEVFIASNVDGEFDVAAGLADSVPLPSGFECFDIAWGEPDGAGKIPFWAACVALGAELVDVVLFAKFDVGVGDFVDVASLAVEGVEAVEPGDFDGNGITDLLVTMTPSGSSRQLRVLQACEVDRGDGEGVGCGLPPIPAP